MERWHAGCFERARQPWTFSDHDQLVTVAMELLGLLGDLFQEESRRGGRVAVRRQMKHTPLALEQDGNRIESTRTGIDVAVGDERNAKRSVVRFAHPFSIDSICARSLDSS